MMMRCLIRYIGYFDDHDRHRHYICKRINIYRHLFGYGCLVDNDLISFGANGEWIYDDLISNKDFERGCPTGRKNEIINKVDGWVCVCYNIEDEGGCNVSTGEVSYFKSDIFDKEEDILEYLLA